MPTRRKVIAALALLLVALLVILVVVVPKLVDIDRYRPEVAAEIEGTTGKKAEIGHLTLSILPVLAIRVDHFALANPQGFPEGDLLRARRIYVELDAAALWHRQVVIRSLRLDHPMVHALSDVRGRRNFDNPGPTGRIARVSLESQPRFSLGIMSAIKISHGQLTDGTLLPSGVAGPPFFEADDVAADLQSVDLNVFTSPTAGAPSPQNTSGLMRSADAHLAYAATPGGRSAGEGTFRADVLRFGDVRATSIKSKLQLGYRHVLFDDLTFDFYSGRAKGRLTFDFAARNTRYGAEGQFHNVDVNKLLAEFPKARGKMTGKMEGDLTLEGEVLHSEDPLAGKRGRGQVMVRNGQLPTLRLNSNLMLLARLSELGPASGDPSSFSSVSADINLDNDRITSRDVKIVSNGVNIDAAGTLTLAGEGSLEYAGAAELRAAQNALTSVLAGLSGAKFADGKLSFPFTLTGTLDNPRFRPGMRGGATGTVGTGSLQPGLVEGLMDLFKKRRK